jgi:hypothetical protein
MVHIVTTQTSTRGRDGAPDVTGRMVPPSDETIDENVVFLPSSERKLR